MFAIPGAAQHAGIARLDPGDISAADKVLPLVDDGDLADGELPVEAKLAGVVDQADAYVALGISDGAVDKDIIDKTRLRPQASVRAASEV